MPDGSEMLLYQYGTQNNPSLVQHGRILQRLSRDDGMTWSHPTDVSAAGISVGYPGKASNEHMPPEPARTLRTSASRTPVSVKRGVL